MVRTTRSTSKLTASSSVSSSKSRARSSSRTQASSTSTTTSSRASDDNGGEIAETNKALPLRPKEGEQMRTVIHQIRDWSRELRHDRSSLNNIVELSRFVTDEAHDEVAFVALQGLRRGFVSLFENRDVEGATARKLRESLQARRRARRIDSASGGDAPERDDPLRTVREWLESQYDETVQKLLRLLTHALEPAVQVAALRALLDFVRCESASLQSLAAAPDSDGSSPVFASALVDRVVAALIESPHLNENVVDAFFDNYANKYRDVRFFALRAFGRVFDERAESGAGENDDDIVRNGLRLLNSVEMVRRRTDLGEWLVEPSDELLASASVKSKKGKGESSRKRKRGGDSAGGSTIESLSKLKPLKQVFTNAWISFLKLPLPRDIYKTILLRLPKHVFPHMTSPLLLMDFFTDAYDQGGMTSVLSLNGVFILISEYNLDYPAFYKKLYLLLEPRIFHVKHAPQFFRLADLFLSSTHLPAYLVAAFAKRIARLALSAPPAGCVMAVAFLYNLMVRHPSIRVLLHRPPPPIKRKVLFVRDALNAPVGLASASASSVSATANNTGREVNDDDDDDDDLLGAELSSSDEDEDERSTKKKNKKKKKKKKAKQSGDESNQIDAQHGYDVFRFDARDPKKTRALESSLWELKVLQTHTFSEVSRVTKVLGGNFKRKTYEMEELAAVTYSSQIETEVKRMPKEPAMTFRRTHESLLSGESFGQWSFGVGK